MNRKMLFGALVGAFLLSAAAYAVADVSAPILGTGTPLSAAGTVAVKATVAPKLVLTITTPEAVQTVDFLTVDPGTTTPVKTVTLDVKSNKVYSISKSVSGADALMGLSTTLANSTGNAKTAGQTFSDDYQLTVPWTTDPGALTANVQYTVTQ